MIIHKRRAFSLAVGWLFVTMPWLGAGQNAEDSQTALATAILAGQTTEIHPYLLLESAQGRITVGAVYTQFVRVARYVWMARQDGRDVDVTDLPDSIKRRELHVVMPLPPHTPAADGTMLAAIQRPPSAAPAGVSVYFVQSERRLTPSIGTIAPDAFQKTVGALPVRRAGLVGMFPPELAQRKVLEICAYRAANDGRVHLVCGYAHGPLR